MFYNVFICACGSESSDVPIQVFIVHEFSFTYIFNHINHGYSAAVLKKNICGYCGYFRS